MPAYESWDVESVWLRLYAEPCCGSKEELFEFGDILRGDEVWVERMSAVQIDDYVDVCGVTLERRDRGLGARGSSVFGSVIESNE